MTRDRSEDAYQAAVREARACLLKAQGHEAAFAKAVTEAQGFLRQAQILCGRERRMRPGEPAPLRRKQAQLNQALNVLSNMGRLKSPLEMNDLERVKEKVERKEALVDKVAHVLSLYGDGDFDEVED